MYYFVYKLLGGTWDLKRVEREDLLIVSPRRPSISFIDFSFTFSASGEAKGNEKYNGLFVVVVVVQGE